jgi:GntR family transcriptional regulator
MELRIEIDLESGIPIYVQLSEQIRLLIRRGALRPDDPMPTVRALAVELGINANTVARVYRDLQREGLLRLRRGVGTFVDRPAAEVEIPARDFRAVAERAQRLVDAARRVGVTAGEIVQLIESLWKEADHAER